MRKNINIHFCYSCHVTWKYIKLIQTVHLLMMFEEKVQNSHPEKHVLKIDNTQKINFMFPTKNILHLRNRDI